MMYGWDYTNGGGYDVWSAIFMFLMTFLVIVGVVLAVRHLSHGGYGSNANAHEDALDILKKRYARGDIDRKEFEEKKKDLGA